jgi:hypothetical protein
MRPREANQCAPGHTAVEVRACFKCYCFTALSTPVNGQTDTEYKNPRENKPEVLA